MRVLLPWLLLVPSYLVAQPQSTEERVAAVERDIASIQTNQMRMERTIRGINDKIDELATEEDLIRVNATLQGLIYAFIGLGGLGVADKAGYYMHRRKNGGG